MPTLDMSQLAVDPDFGQQFVILRKTGKFAYGTFAVTSTKRIPVFGIIQPATDRDLDMVPEGDRIAGMMSFIAPIEMFLTHTEGMTDPNPGLSDEIPWRGDTYGLMAVSPWGDFGFWKAVGARLRGA